MKSSSYNITAIDIGTNTIKTIVYLKRESEENLEYVASHITLSNGIKKGEIEDIDELAKALKESIEEVEKLSGQKIEEIYLSAPGKIFWGISRGVVINSKINKKFSQEEIERVEEEAIRVFSLPPNKEILETFPQEYIIDNEKIQDPLEMQGQKLEVDMSIIMGFAPQIKKIKQVISEIDIDGVLVPGALACSDAILSKKEKNLGVALLNIGAMQSYLLVFDDGCLIHLANLPIGSSHITNNIAIGFKIDINLAEKIKKEFGQAFYLKTKKMKKIKIKKEKNKEKIVIQGNDGSFSFKKKDLIALIEPKILELFNLVNNELKKINRQNLLPGGVVLTGGGAKLPKIIEIAKEKLKLPCRLGISSKIEGIENDPIFSTAVGIAYWVNNKNKEKVSFDHPIKKFIKKLIKTFIP